MKKQKIVSVLLTLIIIAIGISGCSNGKRTSSLHTESITSQVTLPTKTNPNPNQSSQVRQDDWKNEKPSVSSSRTETHSSSETKVNSTEALKEEYKSKKEYEPKEDYKSKKDYESEGDYKQEEDYESEEDYKTKEDYESEEDYKQKEDYKPQDDYGQSSESETEPIVEKNPYIVVSIANQTLQYYEYNNVVLSSPVVTGQDGCTPTGDFQILDKATQIVLIGDDYESYVNYWLAFKGSGYGIHDASWRDEFGGEIYKYNGSHGCINMPYEKVAQLFELVEIGTPVYIQ